MWYKRLPTDFIRAILKSSSVIMMGDSTTVIETKDGETIEGVLRSADGDEIVLAAVNAGAGIALRRIASSFAGPARFH
ncbi:MAG: hypothetical protein M2R45_03706 [Verrucomicrobia subdivision 3 bacterium]|nr:hypothetical protein [Limisphaerales bacterium]MCS1414989.1 hypothetical protein [Limisphaerales bacterium]